MSNSSSTPTDWAPVKKIVAVAVGSAIAWVAVKVGVDLGSDDVNAAAVSLVGIVFGYLTPA